MMNPLTSATRRPGEAAARRRPLSPAHALTALKRIYERAGVVEHHGQLTTVNAFTDQSEPLEPALLAGLGDAVAASAEGIDFDLIAGEEDKGAHIATAASLATGAPLTLARMYVYPVERVCATAAVVSRRSQYLEGQLVLNGIRPGTRVLIVDDTLSTGGTLIALIEAIRQRGGDTAGAIAVIEKVDAGGRARVLKATGIHVRTLLQIRVSPGGVTVL